MNVIVIGGSAGDTIHACALVLDNRGILIRGPAGSGKSFLVHSLLERFRATNRYSSWVCDDQVRLRTKANTVIACAPKNISGLAELRHQGIVNVPHIPAARIDLIVDLLPEEKLDRVPEREWVGLTNPIDGSTIELPLLRAPQRQASVSAKMIERSISAL